MSGNKLALAAVAALAAAGAMRRRGSPKLEELRVDRVTVPQGTPVSTPFKGIVGAAKGGPSLARYERAFARAPFDLRVILVGERYSAASARGKWVHLLSLAREGSLRPEGTVTLIQTLPGMGGRAYKRSIQQSIAAVQTLRQKAPEEAFAIMSPFTLAHRLFDLSYTSTDTPVGTAIFNAVEGGADENDVLVALRDQYGEDYDDLIDVQEIRSQVQSGYDEDDDEDDAEDAVWQAIEQAVYEALSEKADAIVAACQVLDNLDFQGGFSFDPQTLHAVDSLGDIEEAVAQDDALFENVYVEEFLPRLFASLICPTAAGRKVRLTDASQAAADCFATWILSYSPSKGRGAIPLMPITAEELIDFDANAWASKWYEANKHKRMVTARKRDAYARTLSRYEPLIRAISPLKGWEGETVAQEIEAWSQNLADGMPDAMKAAVTLLKAQQVVTG